MILQEVVLVCDLREQPVQAATYQRLQEQQKLCFFFSSRRRHTRFDCDWSSDVCSSDLELLQPVAQIELAHGGTAAAFDWCDRLQELAAHAGKPAASGACAAVAAAERAVVLLVRLADQVEAVVVTASAVRSDPARATELLERAAGSRPVPLDRAGLELAIRRAAPLVRGRLDAIERAQWRAADRDRLTRRLIPWVLAAARRAAARGRHTELARLDALVSRLALGMTAGEEVLLDELLGRRAPLTVRDVLAWHERLPPPAGVSAPPAVRLEAALVLG